MGHKKRSGKTQADAESAFMDRFARGMDRHFPEVTKGDIAVAVSGGPDSMALCYALSDYCAGMDGVSIHALSVDHGLRPESRQEAQHVEAQLRALPNVSHTILTWKKAEQPETRIQEKARTARYALMTDYMRLHNIGVLFLGHHMDDQAETFLLRLAAGSGLDGLAAMPSCHVLQNGISLCRPFLEETKEAILAYCTARKITYIDDPSNMSDRYARVRLRNAMDVLSAEGLTPKRLSVTARRLERARQALDVVASDVYERSCVRSDENEIALSADLLHDQPFDIMVRMVLKGIDALSPVRDYGPRLERVETLCNDFLNSGPFRKRTLHGIIFAHDIQRQQMTLRREHQKVHQGRR